MIADSVTLARPSENGTPTRVLISRNFECHFFYIVCRGCAWRLLPYDLPSLKTVCIYFRRWRKDGTWERVHTVLREARREQEGRTEQPGAAILDSQSVKTVEGGAERSYDAGKKVTGRKRRLIVDTLGLVLLVAATAVSVQDRDGEQEVLHLLFLRIKRAKFSRWCRLKSIWADGGNRGELIVWVKQYFGWTFEIEESPAGQVSFYMSSKYRIVERTQL